MHNQAKTMWKKCVQPVKQTWLKLWEKVWIVSNSQPKPQEHVHNHQVSHTLTLMFTKFYAQLKTVVRILNRPTYTQNPHPLLLQPKGIKG